MSASFKQWIVATAALLAALTSEAAATSCGPCRCYDGENSDWPGLKVAACLDVKNLTAVLANLSIHIQVLYSFIDGHSISKLAENQFNSHKNLQAIYIPDSHINEIEQGAFRYMNNVTEIGLYSNEIIGLPNDCFTYTTKLTKVWLRYNKIKKLQSNLFSNLKYLKVVELSNNEITLVEEHCFHNVPQLEKLYLSTNKLITLDKNFIDNSINLKHLLLEDNPWHCDAFLCGVMNTTVSGALWGDEPVPTCATPQILAGKRWLEALQTGLCPSCTDESWAAHCPGPRQVNRGSTTLPTHIVQLNLTGNQNNAGEVASCADDWPRATPPAIVSNSTSVAEGHDLQLKCQYCAPSRLIWMFNDVKLPSNFVKVSNEYLTSTLTLTNVQKEQHGYYLCRVKYCEDCEDTGLYVTVKSKARSDFYVKQVLHIPDGNSSESCSSRRGVLLLHYTVVPATELNTSGNDKA